MTDQTIRERIRDVVSTSSIVDPHNIAAKLIESATASDRADWLAEVLPRYVGDVLRNDRNSLIGESAIAPRPVRSAKVAGVRDWWHKFTSSTIAVDGTWKAMGELTADDLAVVVAERRDHAAATLRQADRFECLAGLLVTHGAATVCELPPMGIDLNADYHDLALRTRLLEPSLDFGGDQ